ncbi:MULTISPECIES: hydroxyacid dehydrogenase [unclassified Streptococcus]|uniref:hydroxyacid dehydrogenase n=1 Tax=unclassified Streptococcus TaxID=2608887 RepID=UPI00359DDACA
MTKILLSEPISSKAEQLLVDKGFEVVTSPATDIVTMAEQIVDADAVILRSSPMPASVIEASKQLKLISRHATGINNIDLASANQQGVLVAKVNGANAYSVAEYHLTMILALSRRIYKSDQHFRAGKMTGDGVSLIGLANTYGLNGSEIRGKRLVILGYGAIGRELSKIAQALGMSIVAYDPFVKEADIEISTDLKTLYKEADFISICMPLTPETHDFISTKELGWMKETAYLINAGRGGIVNEIALAKALEDGEIAGAALDVFEVEPPLPDNPILTAPNVLLTSHIAGTTVEATEALSFGAVQNVIDFFNGTIPASAVNPEVIGGTYE